MKKIVKIFLEISENFRSPARNILQSLRYLISEALKNVPGPEANFFLNLDQFYKVGCTFTMVISPWFRMGQYRDGDHGQEAPYFTILDCQSIS